MRQMLEAMRNESRAGFENMAGRLNDIETRLGAIESRLDEMNLRVADEGVGGDRLASRVARVDVLARAALEAGQEASAEVDRLARRLSKFERGEE